MTVDQWRQVIDRIQELRLGVAALGTRLSRLHPELFERSEPHLNLIAARLQILTDEASELLRAKPPADH